MHSSYYSATANSAVQHPPLEGELSADVCVVGGGIAGCSTALHLAQRGYRVVLVEANQVGWGASGRSGGQALTGFASGQHKLVQQVGAHAARLMWDVSVEALSLIENLVRDFAIECDLHRGTLHAAIKPRQRVELLKEKDETQRLYGYDKLRLLERAEVEGVLATKRYCAAVEDSGTWHLHPLNYTLGLARAATSAGASIYERSKVTRIQTTQSPVVETERGRVKARFVILCCNAYIGRLAPTLRPRIMPVGTYIVATEMLGAARIAELIRRNVAVSDTNFVLDYFRRSADHRLLFGGRVSYSGLNSIGTAPVTRRRMLNVFPQLADAKIEFAWGGYVDITMSRAPDFGRLQKNVYYLQGFSGHGIALATIAGKLIAEAVAGESERFDLFTKLRHRNFPGGSLLRTPALVLAMMWYRMRDLL